MANLSGYLDTHLENANTSQEIQDAITKAYDQVEQEWYEKWKGAFEVGFPKAGYVGSWALVAVIKGDKLFIAQAGDSEAVLIRRNPEGNFESIKICKAFTCNDLDEQKRLKTEFPDEPNIVTCRSKDAWYVKGSLMPSRSLGDFRLKHKEFNFHYKGPEYGYRKPFAVHNGPYITHKPDIREFDLTKDDVYLILASDGLWDEMKIEEVPSIISKLSAFLISLRWFLIFLWSFCF